MRPIIKILPWKNIEPTIFAKDQPEYLQLPAYVLPDGMVVTRWQLSYIERIKILFQGSFWLTILTFNEPLQPVKLTINCPIKKNDLNYTASAI